MKIIISLVVVFIMSTLLIFKMVYSGNKKETEEERLPFFGVILIVCLLALLPTAAIAFIIFVLLGSTNAINLLFSLKINTNEIIVLAISLLVYLFSIDSIVELVLKQIIGKNIFYLMILACIRILASFVIGLAIGLNQSNSFTIASGVAFILFIIEVLYHDRKRIKEKRLQ